MENTARMEFLKGNISSKLKFAVRFPTKREHHKNLICMFHCRPFSTEGIEYLNIENNAKAIIHTAFL